MQGLIYCEAPPLPGIVPPEAQHYQMFGVCDVVCLPVGKRVLQCWLCWQPANQVLYGVAACSRQSAACLATSQTLPGWPCLA